MIEVIGDIKITPEQVKDAYELIRRTCREHPETCNDCPLSCESARSGMMECRIAHAYPAGWERWA